MGKLSRDKGHGFERLIARLYRVCFPDAKRSPQYRGPEECDVEGTPFWNEVKRYKKFTYGHISRAIEQGEGDAAEHKDDRPVVVITRQDRGFPIVSMRFTTWLTIIERFFWRPSEDDDNVIRLLKDDE